MHIVKRLLKNREISIVKALLLNTIVLGLVILFCDMKYEVSDDFVMQSIVEGTYGNGYDPHLPFSNILFGYGLIFLYRLIPSVGWYFVAQIVICFFSLVAITYIVLDATKETNTSQRLLAWLCLVLFVCNFSDDLYILVQFTKTAAVACLSGGMLFLYSCDIKCKKNKYIGLLLGAILFLIGSIVRNASMKMALMFLFVLFIKSSIIQIKNNRGIKISLVKEWGMKLSLTLVLVFFASALLKCSQYLWSLDNEYNNYVHMNNLRSSVTDYSGGDGEVFRQLLMDKGYTLEDTFMIQSWEFLDQDYFTEESINNIAEYKRSDAYNSQINIKQYIKALFDRKYYSYVVAWVAVVLFFIAIIVNVRDLCIYILMGAVGIFQLLYCALRSHMVYRVEYAVFVCLAGTCLYLISANLNGNKTIKETIELDRIIIALMVILIAVRIPMYIPDNSYKKMSDEEYHKYVEDVLYASWDYDWRKYKINLSKREPYSDIINLMEHDEEHYYLCDFSTTIQLLYYHYKPWKSLPIGYYMNSYSYIGGITSYFPGCYRVWENNGIDYKNPYKSIGNKNIRLVDNYYYLTKIGYYKEKYNNKAIEAQIDEINGMKIWEIRDEE